MLGPCLRDSSYDQVDALYVGSVCTNGVSIPNSREALYLNFLPGSTALIRFDPFTGERTTLFTGEIEWIGDIAPDGRYVLLGLDDSWQSDAAPEPGIRTEPPRRADSTEVVIFDLEIGEMICQMTGLLPGGYFTWIDWRWLVYDQETGPTRLLIVSEDSTCHEVNLPGVVYYWLVDRSGAIVRLPDDSIGLYYFASSTLVPLMPPLNADYDLEFDEMPNGLLRVAVRIRTEQTTYRLEMALCLGDAP